MDPGNQPDAERFFVSITPERDSLVVGSTLPLTARVTDALGAQRNDQTVRWNSLTPDIASVDGVGLVTGVGLGTARVVAVVGLGSQLHADTATVLVQPGTLALLVSPEIAEITLGDSLRLEATLQTPSGADVRGVTVAWSTSDATIAPISTDGTIVSLAPGDVTLTAAINGMSATAQARVLPNPAMSISVAPMNSGLYPGDSVQLNATVLDSRGLRLPTGKVKWMTSAPQVAKVTMDGLVVAQAMRGSAIITASIDNRRASATINVFAVPASSVVVSAPSNSVPRGGRLQAAATARDAEGNELSGKVVAWSSSNPSVAQVGSTGVITGLIVGNTTINAIIDGKIGSMPVSVTNSTPSSLAIVPASATMSLGNTAQLAAEVRDQGGNLIPGQVVSWSSANPGVAAVSSAGVVSAVGAGTVTITATSGTLSAQASITVISNAVASITISPNAAQLQVGGTQQLNATVTTSAGTTLANAVVAWSSSDPAVATVNSTGRVTGIAAGNATISATSSGSTAAAAITVFPPAAPPVASVTVTFNSGSLFVGQTTQAVALARDANGQILTGRTVVWLSDDVGLASVSATGLVTALATGSATIVAKIDGVIGYATLQVGAPAPLPVYTVQLTLAPSSITPGRTAASTVVVRDSLGGILTGRTIGYSSAKPNIASVALGGVVTGVSAGSSVITATSGGKSGNATMTVMSAPLPSVAAISVTANATSLTPGQTTQATATVRDSAGNIISGQVVTWLSSNPAAATVSGTGLVTAVAVGASTITASSGGKSASIAIAVTNPATASVTLTLPASSLTVGQVTQASAMAKDASGNSLPGKPITWSSSNAAVASVTSGGVVTGVSAGSASISASSEGKSASASVTVAAPPPSGTVPSVAAALPQATVDVSWRAPTGRTIAVHAGDNLQNALNSAVRGDEIVIDAGATFTGNFVLPAKTGSAANGWITVRTNMLSALPPLGSRISGAVHGSLMPKIVTNNTMDALRTAPGASGWRLVGIEITIAPGVAVYPVVNNGLVLLGDGSGAQNQLSQVPRDLILDRVYVHGQSSTNVTRCVALNAGATAIVGSQILDCHAKGFDSQAIGGWNGPGPYLIENNRLEAAGEVIMFGGSDPALAGLITSDVTIRRNYITRPMSWQGAWTVKNLFELKNAQRVLLEGNMLENHWVDAQAGSAIVLGSVNQDGYCPQCIVSDITIQYNQVHNVAAVFNVFARCGRAVPGGAYGCGQGGQQTRRVTIKNNLFTGVGAAGLGAGGSSSRVFLLTDDVHDIWIENNTGFAPYSYLTFNGTGSNAKQRFTFQGNIGGGSAYDWFSSAGMGDAANNASLVGGYLVTKNGFVAGASAVLPSGSSRVSSISGVLFTNPVAPSGDWSLQLSSPFTSLGAGVNYSGLATRLAGVVQ